MCATFFPIINKKDDSLMYTTFLIIFINTRFIIYGRFIIIQKPLIFFPEGSIGNIKLLCRINNVSITYLKCLQNTELKKLSMQFILH